jgi:hypothetical protein
VLSAVCKASDVLLKDELTEPSRRRSIAVNCCPMLVTSILIGNLLERLLHCIIPDAGKLVE